MKPRWRPGQKKVDTTCAQWILDGVKRIHQQAISRTPVKLTINQPDNPALTKNGGNTE